MARSTLIKYLRVYRLRPRQFRYIRQSTELRFAQLFDRLHRTRLTRCIGVVAPSIKCIPPS